MASYDVVLLDSDDFVIVHEPAVGNLKYAKDRARYLISDEYARNAETTHDLLGTERAEVRNEKGEVEFDIYR